MRADAGGKIAIVAFDPSAPFSPSFDVLARLAAELSEAAASARHGGQVELASGIEDRVEVVRWAQTRDAARRHEPATG